MLWAVMMVLLGLWLIAQAFDAAGSVVHVLLLVALLVLAIKIFSGRRLA